MTKSELIELIKKHSINYTSEWILRDAVEAYLSASNNGKPLVSGQSEQFFCWDEEALGKESRCKVECEICKNKGEQKNCR